MLEKNLNLSTVLFKKWGDWDLRSLVDLPDIIIYSFSLKPELFADTVAAIFYDRKCITEN